MLKLTKQVYCKRLLVLREKGIRLIDFMGRKLIINRITAIIFPIILFCLGHPVWDAAGFMLLGFLAGAVVIDIRYAKISIKSWTFLKEFIDWDKVERAAEEEG